VSENSSDRLAKQGRLAFAGEPLPPGWKRSKAGSPYLIKAGLTLAVYRRPDGYRWRITPWDRGHPVEARASLLTELAAALEAERALPEARREIEASRSRSSWEREP
jgi:hypothetical protein